MKLRKFLSNQKTKIRMKKYHKQVHSIGDNCYFNNDILFKGCQKMMDIGNHVRIAPNCSFFIDQRGGESKVSIGNDVFINGGLLLNCYSSEIIIGNHCTFGCNVTILGTDHDVNDVEGFYEKLIGKPVHIGDGCWFGTRTIILPGVKLGEHCIVGAGAVVTKSFPAYSMIAGCPAKIIKTYDLEKKEWIRYGK